MVVIQPNIPNGNPLPCTKEELQCIEKHVKSQFLVRLGIENVPATIQEVVSHLPTSHIVHFACHGKQDANDPLESGLILHNGIRLKVKEIMKQSTPNASLAFLSACETAMGAENLPDEAVHLAASLLFAGFRGVVATMW
jgi:CHAT domain-containing protein